MIDLKEFICSPEINPPRIIQFFLEIIFLSLIHPINGSEIMSIIFAKRVSPIFAISQPTPEYRAGRKPLQEC